MSVPGCYGKPLDSPLHSWQLQRTTPNILYRCNNCGAQSNRG